MTPLSCVFRRTYVSVALGSRKFGLTGGWRTMQ